VRVLLVAQTQLQDLIPGYKERNYELDGVHTRMSDELAEQAGRLCYLSWDRPNPKTATNKGYLANILAQSHFSVLEHSSATFYIDGVSRNFTHELIRHRHLSFSEVSQRYVDVEKFEFTQHPGFEDIWNDERQVTLDSVSFAKHVYHRIAEKLIRNGKPRKEARQTARQVLPGGLETKILVTGNMRAWRDVLSKRLSPTADREIREVAQKILAHLREIAPNTFQDFE